MHLVSAITVLAGLFSAGDVLRSQDVEYVRELRSKGWAALAVEYLRDRRDRGVERPELEAEIAFEWGASLSAASETLPDLADREKMLDDARSAFGTFRKKYPDHPSAVDAAVQEAAIDLGRGRIRILQAQLPANEGSAKKTAELGRELFREAEKAYQAADARITKELDGLTGFLDPQKDRESYRRRERLFREQVESQFQTGLVSFLIADSYATVDDRAGDPRKRKEFRESLQRGLSIFQKLAEEHRRELVGLYAELWSARCLTALGEHKRADSLLNGLLAHDNRELEAFQREVFHFRLLSLAAQGDHAQVVRLAEPWLKENNDRRKEPAYQGVQWATARSLIAEASSIQEESDRERLYREADDLLAALSRARGSYAGQASREQLALARQRNRMLKGNTFASLLAQGMARLDEISSEASEEERKQGIQQGIALLEQALAKADAKDPPADLSEAKLRLAMAYSDLGEEEKGLVWSEPMARAEPEVPRATDAALLSASLYARLLQKSPPAGDAANTPADGDPLKKRFQSLADVIVRRWPKSTTADQVRILLAKLAILDQNWKEAVVQADRVTAEDQTKAQALSLAALASWQQTLATNAESNERSALLKETLDRMKQASERWSAVAPTPVGGVDRFRHELIHAEAALLANEPAVARPSADFLAQSLRDLKTRPTDPSLVSSAIAVILRTLLAQGESEQAQKFFGEVGSAAEGKESGRVTSALLGVVRALLTSASLPSGSSKPSFSASERQGIEKLLEALEARKDSLTVSERLYLAEAFLKLGNGAKGKELAEQAMTTAEGTERVIGQMLIARGESLAGEHSAAVQSITQLLREHTGSKEVIWARGEILEAAKDTDGAIKHWRWYLDRLKRVQPRPAELYEVTDRVCGLALSAPAGPSGKAVLQATLRLPAYLLETDPAMPAIWKTKLAERINAMKARLAQP